MGASGPSAASRGTVTAAAARSRRWRREPRRLHPPGRGGRRRPGDGRCPAARRGGPRGRPRVRGGPAADDLRAAVDGSPRPAAAGGGPVTGGTLAPGGTVRDRKWGGQFVGVVRQVEGRDVFVAWHGTVVEDQL